MNQRLIEIAQVTFNKFPLDETVIGEIWKRGWRFYVLPGFLWGCTIGGRVFHDEKYALVRDFEPTKNITSFFHELLHIQHDQEGLTDPRFQQLGLSAGTSPSLPDWSDYDYDCIENEAKRLTKSGRGLLDILHKLHKEDKNLMDKPIREIEPHNLLINLRIHEGGYKTQNEKGYETQEIRAIYLGVLTPPHFRYDYKIAGLI